jgi:RimJ/RimL family protein N-acetyltransferase
MIQLEPFTSSDFSRLISWIDNEEELIQFAGPIFNFPLTKRQLNKYLEDKNRFAFKVVEVNPKQNIGHCEIYLSEQKAKLCRILIGEKSFRGKGLGLQIVNDLLEISFTKFDKSFAELNVFDWNVNAIKCYENAGFVINKNIVKTIEVNGKTWTSLHMTIDKLTRNKIKSNKS